MKKDTFDSKRAGQIKKQSGTEYGYTTLDSFLETILIYIDHVMGNKDEQSNVQNNNSFDKDLEMKKLDLK